MKLLNIFQILFLAISSFETNKKDADGFLNDSGSRKAHGERGKETGRYFRDKYKHGSSKYSERQQEDENREVGRETGRYYREKYGKRGDRNEERKEELEETENEKEEAKEDKRENRNREKEL